jgi:2-oxoglutarate ferredoxin oxidoreductase subunit alpha
VLVLTDKQLAETLYTVNKFDQEEVDIDRGWLVTDEDELKKLKPTDRYKITENGISPRWNPGSSEADFDANSDEHTEEGNVTEDAEPAAAMISKRIRKQETLRHQLPQPELLFNNTELATARAKISFIGWGSTLGVMQDVMQYYEGEDIKVDYIHVKYIWPLQTDLISNYLSEHPDTILIENNHNGQLGQLIKMQAGLDIENKLLKWDGREFTVEDVIDYVDSLKLI